MLLQLVHHSASSSDEDFVFSRATRTRWKKVLKGGIVALTPALTERHPKLRG